MTKKKSVQDKIIAYISKPRKGPWVSARALSHYVREPLERVEFYICLLTDMGMIKGFKDRKSGEYWVRHLWES